MTRKARTMIRKQNNLALLLMLLSIGCAKKAPDATPTVSDIPTVHLVKPETRDLVRQVGQPSFIDSYEQTAIYAKLPGYVLKWNVDIGDRTKKDELLATLFIPELEQEYNLKKAQVSMDQALIAQANKLVDVADGNLKAAVAKVSETEADVGKVRGARPALGLGSRPTSHDGGRAGHRSTNPRRVASAARIEPRVEGCLRGGRKNGRSSAARAGG